MRLSPNFDSVEFRCPCSDCSHSEDPDKFPHPELVRILQWLRTRTGNSIHISSGWRCVEHNRNVGGAEESQHLLGTAADISVIGMSPKEVHSILTGLCPDSCGIGLYKTFVHFDVRETKARWA
jgi:uncharacterized protein YcbK (DUF882 family)